MSEGLVIAVDGPAASGKSTLARRLAEHYGLPFLDTGLLYRAVARRLQRRGSDASDAAVAAEEARKLAPDDLAGADLAGELLGRIASQIAAYPAVREALLPFQRAFGRDGPGAVLAGRDIGTVVRPDATVKIFITASVEERARRRHDELRRRGDAPIYAVVLEELRERDRRDQERAVAPLRAASDAWVVDTTELDVDAAFAAARRHVDAMR